MAQSHRLDVSLKQLDDAVKKIATSKGMDQIRGLEKAGEISFRDVLFYRAGQAPGALMKQFLNASWKGGRSKVHGIKSALAAAVISVQPHRILVHLPEGLQFTDGKGDIYAAAGAFVYGAVRQPLTKAAGSLYKDLITGQMRPRKKAAGDLGSSAKRTVKAAILRGAPLSNRQGKARKAINSGKVSVIAPKYPFFRTTPQQDEQLQVAWIKGIVAELRAVGVETSFG